MFENTFNLKFNLHKAYVDIGIRDDDKQRLGAVYDIGPAEMDAALAEFDRVNRASAQEMLAAYGAFCPQTERKVKIAYLGDSITSDRISHQRIVECALARYGNIEMKDFSVSGYKSSDLFTQYYPGIAEYAPDIAVLMIGTNDMRITDDEYGYFHVPPEEFARNIGYLAAKLSKNGRRVIVCTLPPFDMGKMKPALAGWEILYTKEGRERYDGIILDTVKQHGVELADMRAEYAACDSADITIEDGLHLNAAGQAMLAKKVFGILAPMLEQ